MDPEAEAQRGKGQDFCRGKTGKDRRLESRNSVAPKLGVWANEPDSPRGSAPLVFPS